MQAFWRDFKAFVARGNVLELSVAFILGAAFTTVTRSLANDVLMPPIAFVTGDADFTNRFAVLDDPAGSGPFETLAEAQAGGAVVVSYGVFLNALLEFLLAALVLFVVVRYVRKIAELRRQEEVTAPPPAVRSCPFCRSKIDADATRCPFCTSEIAAAEAAGT